MTAIKPTLPTVTVGISAFNEAATIANLLTDLGKQKITSFRLERIWVISDGSDDKTVSKAKEVALPNLEVTAHQQRKGLAARLTELCQGSTSNVLVILNADIRITDPECLEKIVHPVIAGSADLVSCDQVALAGHTWFERALAQSMAIKNRIFSTYNHGQSIYTCHGTIRAFSRKLYSQITFPHSVGEDAFSYLYAIYHHFSYTYVPDTCVYYREPSSFHDYRKQFERYGQSKTQYYPVFGAEFVKNTYTLPLKYVLAGFGKGLLTSPINVINYLLLTVFIRLVAKRQPEISTTWDIATSSKKTEISPT